MIRNVFAAVFFLCGCACNTPVASTGPKETGAIADTSAVSLENQSLRLLFDKLTLDPKSKGKVALLDNIIVYAGDTIRIKVTPEHDNEIKGQWGYGAAFSTTYAGRQKSELNIGSIGVAATRQEAITTAMEEWYAIFGIPFINLLKDSSPITMAGLKIYPGLMGIRGNLPDHTWLDGGDEMNKKVTKQVALVIAGAVGPIVSVDIKIMLGRGGFSVGECRLNNEVSSQLLDELKKLDWPASEEGCMFKQFYLARKIQ